MEKVVFRLAWAGIGTLIAIEAEGRARPRGPGERHTQSLFTAHWCEQIFINTPLFQQLKPAILGPPLVSGSFVVNQQLKPAILGPPLVSGSFVVKSAETSREEPEGHVRAVGFLAGETPSLATPQPTGSMPPPLPSPPLSHSRRRTSSAPRLLSLFW